MNLSYRWLELYFPPRKIMHEGSQNMKDYMKIYQEWLANPYFDDKTKEELRAIANDENEIKERFYMDLEFGTAGTPRDHRCRNQPYEYLYSPPRDSGTCELYYQTGRSRQRCCDRFRFPPYVPGICHGGGNDTWPQTALRRINLNPFARHRSCPSQSVN